MTGTETDNSNANGRMDFPCEEKLYHALRGACGLDPSVEAETGELLIELEADSKAVVASRVSHGGTDHHRTHVRDLDLEENPLARPSRRRLRTERPTPAQVRNPEHVVLGMQLPDREVDLAPVVFPPGRHFDHDNHVGCTCRAMTIVSKSLRFCMLETDQSSETDQLLLGSDQLGRSACVCRAYC